MNVSARIRKLRLEEFVLTQREFAARLGVDPLTVSRWERGVTRPTAIHRVKLAQLAGVHPSDFLVEERTEAA